MRMLRNRTGNRLSQAVLGVTVMTCLCIATSPGFAQATPPTILEPGYRVTPVPECGYGWNNGMPHPLGPGNILGAACSPGGAWGDFVALSIQTWWDDNGSYVESVDFSGNATGYLGTSGHVVPTQLAFSPAGWRGGDVFFVDISSWVSGAGTVQEWNSARQLVGSFFGGAGSTPMAVDPWGDFNFDLLYDISSWPSNTFQGVFRMDSTGTVSLVSSTATVGHFGSGGSWGTDLYGGGSVLHPDGTQTAFPGGFADRDHFDFVTGPGFGGDLFSLCTVGGQQAICRVHPGGSRTPFATSSAKVLGCGGSLWLIAPGNCYKVDFETVSVEANASISPSSLNVRGNGNDLSIHIDAQDPGTGAPVDLSLLSAAYVRSVSSPSIGKVSLPTPSAAPGCDDATEDGLWETVSQRVIQGSGSATLRLSTPSDGRCATMDGNRQDILALLLDVPDGETATICVAGKHPAYPGLVQGCGTVVIQNRGNR